MSEIGETGHPRPRGYKGPLLMMYRMIVVYVVFVARFEYALFLFIEPIEGALLWVAIVCPPAAVFWRRLTGRHFQLSMILTIIGHALRFLINLNRYPYYHFRPEWLTLLPAIVHAEIAIRPDGWENAHDPMLWGTFDEQMRRLRFVQMADDDDDEDDDEDYDEEEEVDEPDSESDRGSLNRADKKARIKPSTMTYGAVNWYDERNWYDSV